MKQEVVSVRMKTTTAAFLAASILALWAVAASRPVSPYTIDIPYEYPYQPGTQDWIDLGSTIARRKASQVPEEVLEHMTTDALLLTVLDYPFMNDIYAFNTMELGYEAVKKHCNSLREFENRPDCLEALSHYCQANYALSKKEMTLEDYMAERLYWLYISGELDRAS